MRDKSRTVGSNVLDVYSQDKLASMAMISHYTDEFIARHIGIPITAVKRHRKRLPKFKMRRSL